MTEESEVLYYEDRSGAETDDSCGMAYFWQRKYGGMGIVPKVRPEYFKIGSDIHEDLAILADLEDISPGALTGMINEIVSPLTDQDKMDQKRMETLYRHLGWLVAYALYIEPKVRAEYENVSVESEIILDRTPLWVAFTPDRVLRHREGKYLIYREYKTTPYGGLKWVRHWPWDIQIHIGLLAIQEELEEEVKFGQIMGLVKGEHRGERLSHPYVWGWQNTKTGAWTHDYSKARSADWSPAPVWDYPGGVVEWVKGCGEDVALGQFPHSTPCFLNPQMVEEWIERRLARQIHIEPILQEAQTDLETRKLYFEKRTKNCSPLYGDPCPYAAACWNAKIEENPLATGLYEIREPHHEIEVQFYRSRGDAETLLSEFDR